ncbi:hypothetical protein [Nonomuraea sp. NPDC050310]|uniref:hypothetical protein n=1 Tax=Nonomuraea sp. NPDC050310 TaxID=3154935 RepID=UPI0033C0380F
MTEAPTSVRRLVGIYHADGGLWGELAYVAGKLRGTAHCALCDITYGRLRAKTEWADYVACLGVPFDVVHLNERPAEIAAFSEGRTPCVLAETDDGLRMLLGPADLDAAGGDVDRFAVALSRAASSAGLAW